MRPSEWSHFLCSECGARKRTQRIAYFEQSKERNKSRTLNVGLPEFEFHCYAKLRKRMVKYIWMEKLRL